MGIWTQRARDSENTSEIIIVMVYVILMMISFFLFFYFHLNKTLKIKFPKKNFPTGFISLASPLDVFLHPVSFVIYVYDEHYELL